MQEWLISLISVVVGAAIGVGVRELVQWCKRPRLEIDFDKFPRADWNDYEAQGEGYHGNQAVYKAKFLRLAVTNKGKSPALNCEARLRLKTKLDAYISPVHWTKRDPILYRRFEDGKKVLELDKIFVPIDISSKNSETLDLIKFPYWFSIAPDPDADHSPKRDTQYISLVTPLNNLMLFSDDEYFIEVTVYAHNAKATNFEFRCKWDGTVEGFEKAFTKIEEQKPAQLILNRSN